ncbi:vWA domain-containing protein [Sorangium sp. So ce341]|uniref:vWA domain-containing protein n=1 Tax=Sorangium sp. So ce341 TaxID=3133302 RepID=UPI003F61723C
MLRGSFSAIACLIVLSALTSACSLFTDRGAGMGNDAYDDGSWAEDDACATPIPDEADEAAPAPEPTEPAADLPGISVATTDFVTVAGSRKSLRLGFFDDQDRPLAVPPDEVGLTTSDAGVARGALQLNEALDRVTYLGVTAGAPGAATISVSWGGERSDIRVTVLDNVASTMSLSTRRLELKEGQQGSVTALFYHQRGVPLDLADVEVTSSDPRVVLASREAPELGGRIQITARGAGTAAVTVAAGGVRDELAVTVSPQPLDSIELLPGPFQLPPDCSTQASIRFLAPDGERLWIAKDDVTVTSSDPARASAELLTDGDGFVEALEITSDEAGTAILSIAARGKQVERQVVVTDDGAVCSTWGEEEEEEEEEEESELEEAQGELAAGSDPFFYFTYDDSASTAAVELVKHQLRAGEVPPPSLARPWEFLSYERFAPSCARNLGLFDVSMGLLRRASASEAGRDDLLLGVHVAAPFFRKEERGNLVLTLLIDNSGSMSDLAPSVDGARTTRMDVVKHGLKGLLRSLKPGDLVNVVTFNSTAQIELEGALIEPVGSGLAEVRRAIDSVEPTGSTALADGISLAYQIARQRYDPGKLNRIVILTDAYANVGEVDPALIADSVVIGDDEGIYFSGLGVGEDFNEAFLNVLTDEGRGAYFSLITPSDAARAFDQRFMPLLTVAAREVRFKLSYPRALARAATASEESSTDPEDVQPTNFSFNTTQYFYEGFRAPAEASLSDERFKVTISYKDPVTREPRSEEIEAAVGELLGQQETNLRAAEAIFLLNQRIGQRMTAPEVDAVLDTYPPRYSAPLFDEYKALIERYDQLAP